jgi:glycosyltransferase involved in cell wall biosynthesis
MCDFWNEPGVIPEDLRRTFKLIGYVAIDGYPVPDFWVDKYKRFDKLITYTKFGADGINERAAKMNLDFRASYIHHGVNDQVFKPIPRTEVEKYKESHGLGGKKVIGMFSRNQPRKHHPEFIEFAMEVLRKTNNDPDIKFYIHAMENDAGWHLPNLIRDLDEMKLRDRFLTHKAVLPGQEIPPSDINFKDRFFFPGITNPANGLPIEHLNMMYNICDAHVMLTSGEGFGCTVLESLSAGVPTFTNDYAASAELIRLSGGGQLIAARDYTYRGADHNFYRPHTDYEDASTKVIECINNPDIAKKYRRNARAFAMKLSWNNVIYDWDEAISSVFEVDLEKPLKSELV